MPASGNQRAEDAPPLLIRRADRAPLGGLLLAIAILWLAAALGGLVSGQLAIIPGLGNSGAYVAGALGGGFAVIALDWLVRGRTVAIGRGTVTVVARWPLGSHAWREPLANYREIRVFREQRPHRYGARSWYVVRLWHLEPGEAVELMRAKDPALIERCARDYAGRLRLPLRSHRDEATAGHGAERGSDIAAASGAGKPLSAT
jgi:hypothetical protein